MTDKTLSKLRRDVLTRVNLGKRVSPTMLKELLGAEWKEQDALKVSLAETVANLQALEEEKSRSDLAGTEELVRLHNLRAEEMVRSNLLLSNLEAVEEDRLREKQICPCMGPFIEGGGLENLGPDFEGSGVGYGDAIRITIITLGAIALVLYLI